MKYFDSHAHYWDDRFGEEGESLLNNLFATSVAGIVNVGTSPLTCQTTIAQARKYPHMYTALGIHPSDAAELPDDPTSLVAQIREMLLNPENKGVAVGEIGLDYYWEPFDKEKQKRYFCAQMELAQELRLPVVIHDREAHGDCFDIVCRYPNVTGVFHSYSGSPEMAIELVKRGWYISFSGTISFTNARRVREVASVLPHDRVLIETDAPYLTPHPHRGKRNDSGYLSYTCKALADVWGMEEDDVARITYQNAATLFGIPFECDSEM
jgi:TatD DNase family protein